MLVTGLGVTEDERLEDVQRSHQRYCEKQKDWLMQYSTWPHF